MCHQKIKNKMFAPTKHERKEQQVYYINYKQKSTGSLNQCVLIVARAYDFVVAIQSDLRAN